MATHRAKIRRNNPIIRLWFAAAFWCAAVMTVSAEEFVRVSAGQIKPLVSGATLVKTGSRPGSEIYWKFRPDGRLEGDTEGEECGKQCAALSDEGKWWTLATGELCWQWFNWDHGQRQCRVLSLSKSEDRLQFTNSQADSRVVAWEITEKGSRTAQIIAGLRSSGSQQQTAALQPSPAPMAQMRGVAANATPIVPNGPGSLAGIHFGNYHAVVIGNNRYRHLGNLKSARSDGDAVARTLADEYGFKVTKLTDATRSDILGALANMRATLTPDDNLLIYYAGHGIVDSVTEQGYWLPVDADQNNPANWISNTDVTTMLRAIRARQVMVVADSCYSGTLVRMASARMQTSRNKVAWIKRILGKRGRTALVSGGLEPVVDSGTGTDRSVFAKAFITALQENTGILEGHALFDKIKRPVVLNTNQTPQYSDIRMAGHEGGEFMFVRRNALLR